AQRQALFLSLIALVSMQVLLVAGANFNAVVRTVFRIPASAPMTGAATLLVMVVAMVSVLVVARLLRLSEELAQHQADVENWRHVGELFRGMQAQRHDFLNHVQTLLGLLQLGRAQEAERYIQDVFADTTTLNTVSIPGQPSLMALLHAKMGSAAARGIAFDVRVLADPQRVQVPSHELNRILGNLLDNAFDAVEATERRTVSLSIEREQERVVFAVRNPGQLPATMPDRLCEAGFTSKGGSHLGMGLAIVCELVARNGGRFSLRQEQPDQVLARVDFPG
ncbi:MAG: Spo0B domain-containing protein, partial [Syntrophomonadaceae bacterium]|nr:Spo0B domain-containing protein [Syntrophomonadaceae bacterium]